MKTRVAVCDSVALSRFLLLLFVSASLSLHRGFWARIAAVYLAIIIPDLR